MTNPTPAASRFHTRVTRRVLGALAALALAGGLAAGPAIAATASTRPSSSARGVGGPADGAAGGAADFVATLDDDEADELRGGYPNVPGTGLRLGDLDEAQVAAAFALLRSLLSPAAWSELRDLIDADTEIGALDGYTLALFGDPSGDYVLQFSTADLALSAIRQGNDLDVQPDVVS